MKITKVFLVMLVVGICASAFAGGGRAMYRPEPNISSSAPSAGNVAVPPRGMTQNAEETRARIESQNYDARVSPPGPRTEAPKSTEYHNVEPSVVDLQNRKVASAEGTAAKYGFVTHTTTNRPQANAPQGSTFYGASGHAYGAGNISSVPGSPYDVPGGSGQLSTSQSQTLNVYSAGNREYIDPERHNAALDIHDATLRERESVTKSTVALNNAEIDSANAKTLRNLSWGKLIVGAGMAWLDSENGTSHRGYSNSDYTSTTTSYSYRTENGNYSRRVTTTSRD